MIPMTGTIKSAVKLAEMDSKWQQKKENFGNKIFQQETTKTPEQLQIEAFQKDLERMRENDDYAMVYNKLKNGKKLSPEEVEYLQKNDPQAYADYKIAQAEKEAFKKKLRNCKTKDEVRELKVTEMGNYLSQAKTVSNNPHIPKSKKLEILGRIMSRVMGLEEVYQEFVKSTEYTDMEDTRLQENEETAQDTILGKEFAEIETIFEGVKNGTITDVVQETDSRKMEKPTENVENNATQEAKCNS